jgi:hypothetical protein
MARYLCALPLLAALALSTMAQSMPSNSGQQAPEGKSMAQSLGVYVYPKQNQNKAQQDRDEYECYQWAKGETGIDPAAPPPATPAAEKVRGGGAKGAAAGASGGAVVGAITGDAGQGAAAGAAVGAMRGRRQQKKANKQAEKQAEAAGKQQQEQRLGTFRKGYSACLDGRGYSVK